MRICRVATIPFYFVSQLKEQIYELIEAGHEVTLITSSGPELSQFEHHKKLNIKVIEIPRSIHPFKDIIALFRLMVFFLFHRFDIVHSYTPKAGLLTALAAFITKQPKRLHTWTGQQWLNMKGFNRIICRIADRFIGLLSSQCYVDSPSQKRLLISESIIHPDKISVIGNGSLAGVNTSRFNSDRWSVADREAVLKKLRIPSDSTVITFIGRINEYKGIRELFSAFIEICRKRNLDLLMVGPIDNEHNDIINIIEGIHDHPRIHFTGYTSTPEFYLAVTDILCLPSYREGFGTVVIEAASMGIPTVGTIIDGIIDAIVDKETGLLVPARDVNSLMEALLLLIDNPDFRNSLGEKALYRCRTFFNSKTMNLLTIKEYEKLVITPAIKHAN